MKAAYNNIKTKTMNNRIQSFKYALNGIIHTLSQPNMQIHFIIALLVILAGFLLEISGTEWILTVIAIGMVMTAECFNTSIEKLTNIVSPEYNKTAGQVKDIAAGAVLLSAAAAAITGLIIFLPKIIQFVQSL